MRPEHSTYFSSNTSKILLFYRRHPINLLVPTLVAVVLLMMVSLVLGTLSTSFVLDRYFAWVILFTGLTFFVIGSYWIMQWLFWHFDIWMVTEDKLIDSQLTGLFMHSRVEFPLRQVQDITHTTTGLLANIFQCGNIMIQTASKQNYSKLMWIYRPQKAVDEISALVQKATHELYGVHEFSYLPVEVKLGELLVGRNVISQQDLIQTLEEQKTTRERLGKMLLRKNLITKPDLLSALSAQYHIPQMDLTYLEIDPRVTNCLTPEIAHKYNIIPIFKTPSGVVQVAVSCLSEELVKEVKEACGYPVSFVLGDEEAIASLIDRYYPPAISKTLDKIQ